MNRRDKLKNIELVNKRLLGEGTPSLDGVVRKSREGYDKILSIIRGNTPEESARIISDIIWDMENPKYGTPML